MQAAGSEQELPYQPDQSEAHLKLPEETKYFETARRKKVKIPSVFRATEIKKVTVWVVFRASKTKDKVCSSNRKIYSLMATTTKMIQKR